jgi:peptidoglycan/LPS O-acetylase OafA/YrhL
MIKTLTSWRGLLAVAVVLFHYHLPIFKGAELFAVCFFYVVSGFLLALRYDSKPLPGWRQFFEERALRLYLMNWLALLPIAAILILYHEWDGTAQFITDLLLVQSYVPDKSFYFSFNTVAWFLCGLILCYACFPWLLRLLRRWSLRVKLCGLAIWVIAMLVLLPQLPTMVRVHFYVNPLIRTMDFVAGMTLAHVFTEVNKKQLNIKFATATLLELLVIAVVAVITLLVIHVPNIISYEDFVIWYIPAGMLVLVCALLNGREGLLGRLLCLKPFQWLGTISLEIYIFQILAARIYNYFIAPVLGHFGFEQAYNLYPFFGLLVLIPLSWLVHRYVTTRLWRWAKQRAS